MKTKQLLEREQERVEKVKRAREKAVANAMEKSAHLILKERRYHTNLKRHNKMMAEEESFRVQHFYDLTEKRNEARQFTLENDQRLDDLGYDRYKKDMSEIEEHVENEK